MVPLPETIRMFPLAEVVLFPETLLPLHIFEPRYRKMLADALAAEGLLGMVLARANRMEASCPVYPVGCAGRIIEHRPFEDGRSVIVLRGTVKFRILGELPSDEPYRVVRVQALHEAPAPAEEMRSWQDELRDRMQRYARALGDDEATVTRLFRKLAIESLVNHLSASLPFAVVEKQSLLECATIERRFARLCKLIVFKTAEAELGLDSHREADC